MLDAEIIKIYNIMKKFWILLLFAIISMSIIAQTNSIGIFGGANMSKMNIMEITDVENPDGDHFFTSYEPLFGFVGGINYQRTFQIPITLDVGVMFNQYGCKFDPGIPISVILDGMSANITVVERVDSDFRCVFNYMSIPVLIGYKFGEKFSIIPKIGIQMSYLIDSRIKGTNNGVMYDNKIDLEYYNRFDFAGVVDVELCYDFNSNLGVFFDLSGKYSFTNSANFVNIYKDTTFYHYSLSTVLGVKYSF